MVTIYMIFFPVFYGCHLGRISTALPPLRLDISANPASAVVNRSPLPGFHQAQCRPLPASPPLSAIIPAHTRPPPRGWGIIFLPTLPPSRPMTSAPLHPRLAGATMTTSRELHLPGKHFSPLRCLILRADKGWRAASANQLASTLRSKREDGAGKASRVRLGQRLIMGSGRDRACH